MASKTDIESRQFHEIQPLEFHELDELTGLPNRSELNPTLDRFIDKYPGEFSLLYIDLDDLKIKNDTEGGHEAGDKYLKAAADVLKDNLRSDSKDREPDLLFAGRPYRVGGDEFIAILSGAGTTTEQNLEIIMKRLDKALSEAGVSASMAAVPHKQSESKEQLIQSADKLMYKNKEGKKQARYQHELIHKPLRKVMAHVIGQTLLDYSGIKKPGSR